MALRFPQLAVLIAVLLKASLLAFYALPVAVATACAQANELNAGTPLATPTQLLLRRLENMQSYSADFTQRLLDDKGELLQESQGLTQLSRPGLMRWQTREPYANLLVANENVLWRYDADLEQAIRQPVGDDLSKTPALLLTGDALQLETSYKVAPAELAGATSGSAFSLTPRADGSMFRELQLSFDKNGVLQGMAIIDDLMQRTEIVFSNTQLNPTINAKAFSFEPPAGVDIILHD